MSIEVIALLITVFITVVGWAVMFGVCKQKIQNNTEEIEEVKKSIDSVKATHVNDLATLKADFQKDIDEIKADSKEQSVILQSINNNLAAMNNNFDLLLNGHLKIKGVTE